VSVSVDLQSLSLSLDNNKSVTGERKLTMGSKSKNVLWNKSRTEMTLNEMNIGSDSG